MYVWFSQLGFPHSTLEFPYKRQSPLTKKNKEYDSITLLHFLLVSKFSKLLDIQWENYLNPSSRAKI